MSITSIGDSIYTMVMNASEHVSSSTDSQVEDIVLSTLVLSGLLFLFVPIFSLGNNFLLLVLVPLSGICFGIFIYQTDRIFSGLVSGFFVLVIFDANIPIFSDPLKAQLDLYIVDPIAIVLLIVLVSNFKHSFEDLFSYRLGVAAVVSFAVFVMWAYLSAIVGNGPSQVAAAIFAVDQTRYLLLFVVSILIIRQTNVWFGIYPLMISIAGNLLYAAVEAVSGRSFGLTYLGDTNGKLLGEFTIGTWQFSAGYYPGGYVGTSRMLLGLLLLLIPFCVFWSVYGERDRVAIPSILLTSALLIIKFGDTDAGWSASILVLGLLGGLCLFIALSERFLGALRGLAMSTYGICLSLFLYLERFVPNQVETASGGSTGGTSGTNTVVEVSTQERIVSVLARVPGAEVDTLGIRLTQYAASIDIALQYPLFGIGGYNFVLLSTVYGLPAGLGVHNTFFSHLAATGIPGFLAYMTSVLAVLALVAYATLRVDSEERLFWGCMFVGLLGFHAYSFWVVMYGWQTSTAGFWAFSGIAVGALSFKKGSSWEPARVGWSDWSGVVHSLRSRRN